MYRVVQALYMIECIQEYKKTFVNLGHFFSDHEWFDVTQSLMYRNAADFLLIKHLEQDTRHRVHEQPVGCFSPFHQCKQCIVCFSALLGVTLSMVPKLVLGQQSAWALKIQNYTGSWLSYAPRFADNQMSEFSLWISGTDKHWKKLKINW